MDWLEALKFQLNENLPGEAAHAEMAPVNRPLSSFARKNTDLYRESAVSVILQVSSKNPEIILIQRPNYEGVHGGQVSFPGGKKDESDENLFQTAIRECKEEIGIDLYKNQFVGLLTPVFIPVSKFDVLPHVFILDSEVNFTPDPREVETIFKMQISSLMNENIRKRVSIPTQQGTVLKNIPCFEYENRIIWGATALMLNELRLIFESIKY